MTPEAIFGIIVAAAIALGLLGKLFPKSEPKERHFKCSRCRAVSSHTERTREAWRNGKTRFFCQACHAEWLKSRPRAERDPAPLRGSGQAGCLGVAIAFVIIPLAGYVLASAHA